MTNSKTCGAYKNAYRAFTSSEISQKLAYVDLLRTDWEIQGLEGDNITPLPKNPARPPTPLLVPPADVPKRRIGNPTGRAALLHAIAHIEYNAIDLALDMIGRFGPDPLISETHRASFITDWISVAHDEARHFSLLQSRLSQLGYQYGDFPAHNGLWEAAISTHHSLPARLVVAPMVLEARGLDVTPSMISQFKRQKDKETVKILEIIYHDEINHVATGTKWFHYVAQKSKKNPETYFKQLVSRHYKGKLKPPFNNYARDKAGLPQSYYTTFS